MNGSFVNIAGGVVLGAVAAVLALKFVGPAAAAHPRTFCEKAKQHCIKVTVDSKSVVQVDAEPLTKHGKNHTIHWIIDNDDNQNYTFPATGGIVFPGADKKGNKDGGDQEFPPCYPDIGNDPNGLIFACDDYDGTPSASANGYFYVVTVVDANGNKYKSDPHIVNN